MMRQVTHVLRVQTRGVGFTDLTPAVRRWVREAGIATGLLTVFIRHTSASLLIQENADPTVRADLEAAIDRLAPRGAGLYRHDDEGPDDMPGHIRAMLTQTTLGIPVLDGAPTLGTWQAIYLWEHRDAPHAREVVLHLIGD